MGDLWVQKVQKWLNEEYRGRNGYVVISEDGIVGLGTCKALIRAMQLELGISTPNGTFGPATISAFIAVGIKENTSNKNLIRILQGGFYCKGIECGGFDGIYGYKLSQAILTFKMQTGIGGDNPYIDARHMKALLNTDPFVGNRNGKVYIRIAQQYLNKNYSDYFWEKIGLIPCNGITDRNMTKALAYALQYEEGERGSGLDGVVGTNTLNKAPVLSIGSSQNNFIKLLQIAIACIALEDVDLDGVFDQEVKQAVSNYQQFMCLNQDTTVTLGTVCRKTWASFMISKGDVTRYCDACDCSQKLSLAKARALKAHGYNYVGRYLTGTVGGTRDKSLSLDEIANITEAGLNIFAIYQDGGSSATYFNYSRGYSDAQKAITAAGKLHIPLGEIIYFAVDYDFTADQTKDIIVSHFQGINDYFKKVDSKYQIGIYGSRNICSTIAEENLSCSSFVADMSTGYSGNMGYRLPINWAFDQFYEYIFTNYDNYDGDFAVDKNVASGRYKGFNGNLLCGHENYHDVTLHNMMLQADGYYECSVCGYRVKHPLLQDAQILSERELLEVKTGYTFFFHYCYLESQNVVYSNMDSPKMLLDAIQRIRATHINAYEFSDGNGVCVVDQIRYPHNPDKMYFEYPFAYGKVSPSNLIIYDGTLSSITNAALCIFSPHYALYQSAQEIQEIIANQSGLGEMVLIKIIEFFASKATDAMGGDKVLEYLVSLLELGVEINTGNEYSIEVGDYVVEYPIYQESVFTCKNSFIVYDVNYKVKAIVFNDMNS